MSLNTKFVMIGLTYFVIRTHSQKIGDLAFRAGGTSVSEITRNCSYPCERISNKMVEFVLGILV